MLTFSFTLYFSITAAALVIVWTVPARYAHLALRNLAGVAVVAYIAALASVLTSASLTSRSVIVPAICCLFVAALGVLEHREVLKKRQ